MHIHVCMPSSHHVLHTPGDLPGTPGSRLLEVPAVCLFMETPPCRPEGRSGTGTMQVPPGPGPSVTADPSEHSCLMSGPFLRQKFIECTIPMYHHNDSQVFTAPRTSQCAPVQLQDFPILHSGSCVLPQPPPKLGPPASALGRVPRPCASVSGSGAWSGCAVPPEPSVL